MQKRLHRSVQAQERPDKTGLKSRQSADGKRRSEVRRLCAFPSGLVDEAHLEGHGGDVEEHGEGAGIAGDLCGDGDLLADGLDRKSVV